MEPIHQFQYAKQSNKKTGEFSNESYGAGPHGKKKRSQVLSGFHRHDYSQDIIRPEKKPDKSHQAI
jgi:hypothetical protein